MNAIASSGWRLNKDNKQVNKLLIAAWSFYRMHYALIFAKESQWKHVYTILFL